MLICSESLPAEQHQTLLFCRCLAAIHTVTRVTALKEAPNDGFLLGFIVISVQTKKGLPLIAHFRCSQRIMDRPLKGPPEPDPQAEWKNISSWRAESGPDQGNSLTSR